jgi:hypothetical protein
MGAPRRNRKSKSGLDPHPVDDLMHGWVELSGLARNQAAEALAQATRNGLRSWDELMRSTVLLCTYPLRAAATEGRPASVAAAVVELQARAMRDLYAPWLGASPDQAAAPATRTSTAPVKLRVAAG